MKLFLSLIVGLFFIGCASLQKGDYVTYTSDEYLFIQDNFINQSLKCLELGESKQGGLNVKYCVGVDYASHLVQGFMFEHKYSNVNERYIGAHLSFQRRKTYKISCTSETVGSGSSGVEYINCMTPKRNFDVYGYIMSSKKDINGEFKGSVGNEAIYKGVINKEDRKGLRTFYKSINEKSKENWKDAKL